MAVLIDTNVAINYLKKTYGFAGLYGFGFFTGTGFLNRFVKKEERKNRAAGFADGQRGCQPGFSEEPVKKEHKRNIENKLPDKGMEERLLSFAHCLHAEGRMIIDELHRRGDTPDSEEQGRVSDGDQGSFRVAGGALTVVEVEPFTENSAAETMRAINPDVTVNTSG